MTCGTASTARTVRYIGIDRSKTLVNCSPLQALVGGRQKGRLAHAGNSADDAWALKADVIVYGGTATYDLLPSGETVWHWASGVLLKSSLQP